AQYRELLRLYPLYVEGRVELGFALSDLDRYPEAIEQFEEALNHSPRDQAAQRGLAAMLLSINHSADVITACEGLLREYPADWVGCLRGEPVQTPANGTTPSPRTRPHGRFTRIRSSPRTMPAC